MLDQHLKSSWWALRLTFGLVPIIAGLDKFMYVLTNWNKYLSDTVLSLLPMSANSFMQWVGVIEIAAGLLVLSKYTRWGAYVVAGWLVAIAINLVMTGQYFDIAVRDLVMAVGAVVLAKMTEAREGIISTRRARPVMPAHA